jgi:hypothetical protein
MIDETIAHYRITAKLGEGGMGEVHHAMTQSSAAFAADAGCITKSNPLGRVVAVSYISHDGIAAAPSGSRATRRRGFRATPFPPLSSLPTVRPEKCHFRTSGVPRQADARQPNVRLPHTQPVRRRESYDA